MNGWGDYRPVKKDEKHEEKLEFKDVMKVFNQKYGNGTLVHPGMVDPYADKNVIQLDELDDYLDLPQQEFHNYNHHDDYEHDKDPEGYEYAV